MDVAFPARNVARSLGRSDARPASVVDLGLLAQFGPRKLAERILWVADLACRRLEEAGIRLFNERRLEEAAAWIEELEAKIPAAK